MNTEHLMQRYVLNYGLSPSAGTDQGHQDSPIHSDSDSHILYDKGWDALFIYNSLFTYSVLRKEKRFRSFSIFSQYKDDISLVSRLLPPSSWLKVVSLCIWIDCMMSRSVSVVTYSELPSLLYIFDNSWNMKSVRMYVIVCIKHEFHKTFNFIKLNVSIIMDKRIPIQLNFETYRLIHFFNTKLIECS